MFRRGRRVRLRFRTSPALVPQAPSSSDLAPTRRGLIAGAAGLLLAGAAFAGLAAPAADRWIAYQRRLAARLQDAAGGAFDEAAARALLAKSNQARAEAGVGKVVWHPELAATARAHVADMAQRDYFEHLSPEGFDPTDRLGLVGRTTLGSTSENIAYHRGSTPGTAEGLFDLWRKSPPHWMNLRRDKHTHAGFAVLRKGDRTYAAGLYARPDGALAEAVPFVVREPQAPARALAGLPSDWRASAFVAGQQSGRGYDLADLGSAPSGVYKLQIEKPTGPRSFLYLPGPVVYWAG